MPCYFCEAGQIESVRHDACQAELEDRARESRCLRCGGRRGTDNAWCSKCNDMDDPPFSGFPPRDA